MRIVCIGYKVDFGCLSKVTAMYIHLARSCSGLYFGCAKKLRLMDVSVGWCFCGGFRETAETRAEKSTFLQLIGPI